MFLRAAAAAAADVCAAVSPATAVQAIPRTTAFLFSGLPIYSGVAYLRSKSDSPGTDVLCDWQAAKDAGNPANDVGYGECR